jgi:hypothetical protein
MPVKKDQKKVQLFTVLSSAILSRRPAPSINNKDNQLDATVTVHVELIGIINKPLLLHLVGCLYYLYQ